MPKKFKGSIIDICEDCEKPFEECKCSLHHTTVLRKLSVSELRKKYLRLQSQSNLNCYDVVLTVNPAKCPDLQYAKKNIMHQAIQKMQTQHSCYAFILTREDTKAGWPHIHALVWYNKSNDSANCLVGNSRFSMFGKNSVYPVRTEPYKQIKKNAFGKDIEVDWKDSFDYIMKDQSTKWREPNAYGQKTSDFLLYNVKNSDGIVD